MKKSDLTVKEAIKTYFTGCIASRRMHAFYENKFELYLILGLILLGKLELTLFVFLFILLKDIVALSCIAVLSYEKVKLEARIDK